MTFDSLEDNFMKKINEPVKTDVQISADAQKKVAGADEENKETYEEKLVKKQVIGGLAALFQEKIKETKQDEEESDTVFISTENIKYGDKFVDATNYVSEKDIQKFMPGDVYNDSIKEPQLESGQVEFDQRHSPVNKYDDNLSFEPKIASENDIAPTTSISRSVNAETPYSDEEIAEKLATHNEKKNKKQFSENTWSPVNSYNSGPQISDSQIQNKDDELKTFQETELSREEHEKQIQEMQSSVVDNKDSDVDE